MVRFNLQLFAKSVDAIAKEVIKGNYGNGATRVNKLTKAGYDASAVQARVNEMLGVGSKKTTTAPAPKATTTTPAPAAKTPKNTPSAPEIKGVDNSLVDTINSKYAETDELLEQKQGVTDRANAYMDFASNTDIISSDVWAGMTTPYSKSSAVLQAEQLLQSKIDQGYAGTHKEALNNLLNDFMNREDFEYDVDKDQMFQQALASAMGSGKTAMQDTMGQAAALTGGYGSTYATTAGNQAYNAFIEDAYNNLPEYYNMALAAYEAEGQQMLQQYNMLDAADTKEYGQWYDDVNLTYQSVRDMVSDEYNQWNANQTMYANTANMQLAENAQIGNNLYNMYSVASNEYENAYAKDWQNWQQSIDSAYKMANMQSNDYWNNENLNFQRDQAAISQSNWEKSYALDLAQAGATKDKNGNVIVPDKKGSTLTNTELEKAKEIFINSGGNHDQVGAYLTSIGKNDMDTDQQQALESTLISSSPVFQNWEMYDDTVNGGWFFGTNLFGAMKTDDHNDVYSNMKPNEDGTLPEGAQTMTFDQLKKAIEDSNLSAEEKKKRIQALKDKSKR